MRLAFGVNLVEFLSRLRACFVDNVELELEVWLTWNIGFNTDMSFENLLQGKAGRWAIAGVGCWLEGWCFQGAQ